MIFKPFHSSLKVLRDTKALPWEYQMAENRRNQNCPTIYGAALGQLHGSRADVVTVHRPILFAKQALGTINLESSTKPTSETALHQGTSSVFLSAVLHPFIRSHNTKEIPSEIIISKSLKNKGCLFLFCCCICDYTSHCLWILSPDCV